MPRQQTEKYQLEDLETLQIMISTHELLTKHLILLFINQLVTSKSFYF